jgi:putative transposase
MTQQHHLNHATWDCKYHVVFIPKYRKKAVFGKIKKNLGAVFHDLARRRECRIEEGHLMPDHVQMLVSIPPKYSVAEVIGFIKAKARFGSRRILSEMQRTSRTQFLGTRIFRLDGGPGQGDDPGLHQEPGASGSPDGSTCADPIVPSQK